MRTFDIVNTITVTDDAISNLLVTAFEGGINYWCGRVEIGATPENNEGYMSDVINNGGTLFLHDVEDEDEIWELREDNLLRGIRLYMKEQNITSIEDLMDNHDAETADCIIQYALFGELTFC